MAANRIVIQVDFQDQNAEQGIVALNQQIKNIGTTSEKASQQATGALNRITIGIDETTRSANQMVTAFAALGGVMAVKQWVEMAEAVLRMQVVFSRLGATADDLKSLRSQLGGLADEIGTTQSRLASMATRLAGVFKVPSDQVPGLLKMFADISAGTTGSLDNMEKLGNAFGLMWERGRITAREANNKLNELGLNAEKIIRQIYNLRTHAEFVRALSSEQTTAPITSILGAAYAQNQGAAKQLADQLPSAQLQRSLNQLQESAIRFFEMLAPHLTALIQGLTQVLALVEELGTAFSKLDDTTKGIVKWIAYIAAFAFALSGVIRVVTAIIGVFKVLLPILGLVWTALEAISGVIAAAAAIWGLPFEGMALIVAGLLTLVVSLLKYFGWLDVIVKKIGEGWDWLTQKLSGFKHVWESVKEAIFPKEDGPAFIDVEKIKRQHDAMEEALAEARTRLARVDDSSIAGIIDRYNNLRKTLEGNAKEIARLPGLYAIAAQVEIDRMGRALDAELRKLDVSINRVQRQIAIIESATPVTDTYEQRRQEAGLGSDARAKEYAEDAQAAIRENARKVDAEIAGIRVIAEARRQEHVDSAAAQAKDAAQVGQLEGQKAAFAAKTQEKLLYDTAKARAEAIKEIHAAEFEEWKKFYDQEAAYAEQKLNSTYTVRKAAIEAVPAQTIQQRKAQIDELSQLELEHIKEIGDLRLQTNQDEWDKRIEEARGNAKEIAEINRKYMNQEAALRLETETNTQTAIIESWKQTNEVILEQQRTVYGQLESAVGTMWDALTDRSKSVWDAIGNAMKSALMGAMKSIVTSNLAAALTGALGYGGVSIQRRGLWGTIPVFSGAGAPPSASIPMVTEGVKFATEGDGTGGASRMMAEPMIAAGGALTGAAGALTAAAGALTSAAAAAGASPMAISSAASTISSAASTTTAAGNDIYNLPMSHGSGWQLPGMAPGMSGSLGVGGGGGSSGFSLAGLGRTAAPLAAMLGTGLFTRSLGKTGIGAGLQGILGGALGGYGLAKMFGQNPISGIAAGGGLGILSAGWKQGGVGGLFMDVGGGALAGIGLGSMIGGLVGGPLGFAAGAVIGGIAGAAAGLGAGIARLFVKTKDEQVRALVKQVYGVDIAQQSIRQQIVDLANQKYGGDVRLAVYSTEVQDLVRLYSLSSGQSQAGLPRPMYAATFAQSGAGGLQAQPVYSGGQLIANPYVGTTTSQWANATAPLYMQLNPAQARDLFAGQVVQVLGDNPGAVGAANTTAARSGQSRQAQAGAILEPATVMR